MMTASQVNNTDSKSIENDLKPEQALGLIGLGLMQKITHEGKSNLNWLLEEDGEKADLLALRQRLELTSLAIETGAPLSTAEVSHLLGARPTSAETERGGLIAKRASRNVWKLSRAEKEGNYWRN
tara:strand:+ start:280 stop:654 length:375 start_codon:yes stop_codon:yes gene_type:complete